MSDEKLEDLMNTLPDEGEIAFRAARARHRALARLDEPEPARVPWLVTWNWVPALTVAAAFLIFAGVLFRTGGPAPATQVAMNAAPAERQQESLRMKWVLEDGTRVIWTFREDF
jgi:hypothetical protein